MQKSELHSSQLWALVSEGDEHAFEMLYAQNVEALYNYGLKLTPKTQLIEDCIQELFIRIFRNNQKLGKPQNIRYYLLKSFRNNLIRQLEKEKKLLFRNNDDYYFDIVFPVENQIVEEEEKLSRNKLLTEALKKLSARQKEAIYLKYTCGLNYVEISDVMKMGVESCRNTVYRAVKSLRKTLPGKQILLFLIKK